MQHRIVGNKRKEGGQLTTNTCAKVIRDPNNPGQRLVVVADAKQSMKNVSPDVMRSLYAYVGVNSSLLQTSKREKQTFETINWERHFADWFVTKLFEKYPEPKHLNDPIFGEDDILVELDDIANWNETILQEYIPNQKKREKFEHKRDIQDNPRFVKFKKQSILKYSKMIASFYPSMMYFGQILSQGKTIDRRDDDITIPYDDAQNPIYAFMRSFIDQSGLDVLTKRILVMDLNPVDFYGFNYDYDSNHVKNIDNIWANDILFVQTLVVRDLWDEFTFKCRKNFLQHCMVHYFPLVPILFAACPNNRDLQFMFNNIADIDWPMFFNQRILQKTLLPERYRLFNKINLNKQMKFEHKTTTWGKVLQQNKDDFCIHFETWPNRFVNNWEHYLQQSEGFDIAFQLKILHVWNTIKESLVDTAASQPATATQPAPTTLFHYKSVPEVVLRIVILLHDIEQRVADVYNRDPLPLRDE